MKIYPKIEAIHGRTDKHDGSVVPLVYLHSLGDGASVEAKRRKTGVTWARGYNCKNPNPKVEVHENNFIPGFRLSRCIRRYTSSWGNNRVTAWRVEDPRGFELEITSENIAQLVLHVGIEKEGHIPGECCWARDQGRNVLIPRGTAMEIEALEHMAEAEATKKKKAAQKGLKLNTIPFGAEVKFFSDYKSNAFYLGCWEVEDMDGKKEKKAFFFSKSPYYKGNKVSIDALSPSYNGVEAIGPRTISEVKPEAAGFGTAKEARETLSRAIGISYREVEVDVWTFHGYTKSKKFLWIYNSDKSTISPHSEWDATLQKRIYAPYGVDHQPSGYAVNNHSHKLVADICHCPIPLHRTKSIVLVPGSVA